MIKKIGFVVIIAATLFALRPTLFNSILGTDSTIDMNIDPKDMGTRGKEVTEYAEGYNESDFGDAFSSPLDGKFIVKPEDQPSGPWEDLLELKFSIKYDEEVDDVIFKPKFTKKIRSYEGKIVTVQGFIIPHDIAANAMGDVEDDGQSFMFSAFPLASCFFCGGAGAESVMEAFPKKPIEYTERKITIKGRLEFNETDFLRLPYILKDAVVVEDI